MIDSIRHGRCLCGSVSYEVFGEPVIVAHCHCVDCQRLTGAGHSTGAMFPVSHLTTTGRLAEFKLQSNNGNEVTRVFCPSCGSPLWGRNTAMPGFVTISLGTFEDASSFAPSVTIFARNRWPWDVMDDALATFDAQPQWQPADGA